MKKLLQIIVGTAQVSFSLLLNCITLCSAIAENAPDPYDIEKVERALGRERRLALALAHTISQNRGERDTSFALTPGEYQQVMHGTPVGEQARKRVWHSTVLQEAAIDPSSQLTIGADDLDKNEIVTGRYDPPPGAVTIMTRRLAETMSVAYNGVRSSWEDEGVPKTAVSAMYFSRIFPNRFSDIQGFNFPESRVTDVKDNRMATIYIPFS